jgi:hypothetical protein
LLIFYRRYHKDEIQKEIRISATSAVSQYFAVQNADLNDSNEEIPGI